MDPEREKLFLDVANVLTTNRGASTGEIAAAAGISRATLHRIFGSRDALVEKIYRWLLVRSDERLDAAGVDPVEGGGAPLDPVLDVFERLTEDSFPLAQSLWLLISAPQLEQDPELLALLETQDLRLEKFFRRGQDDGVFRADLPARWLAYSLGSQVMSAWYLVEDGYTGAKDVPRLVRTAVLDGALAPGRTGKSGPASGSR